VRIGLKEGSRASQGRRDCAAYKFYRACPFGAYHDRQSCRRSTSAAGPSIL